MLAATAGCRQILGLDDLATGRDGGLDPDAVATDGPLACEAWTPMAGHFLPCEAPPGDPITLAAGSWIYDSDAGTLTDPSGATTMPQSYTVGQAGGPEIRVLSTFAFKSEPNSTLRVVGSHPLVIASWGATAISGTLSVASVRSAGGVDRGAGANGASCSQAEPGESSTESGGGGGGGFGEKGGDGGNGKNGGNNGGTGANAMSAPAVVHGGCAGARGGSNQNAGAGGDGGGAIEIASPVSILIDGTIHAGGAGGAGASGQYGGGGGGSGGYIGLDAPMVTIANLAVVAANGGGGGAGCAGGTGASGADGLAGLEAAPGGGEGSCSDGTRGGTGGARAQGAGETGASGGHGGAGGGGGVGFVFVWATSAATGGTISPSPMMR